MGERSGTLNNVVTTQSIDMSLPAWRAAGYLTLYITGALGSATGVRVKLTPDGTRAFYPSQLSFSALDLDVVENVTLRADSMDIELVGTPDGSTNIDWWVV